AGLFEERACALGIELAPLAARVLAEAGDDGRNERAQRALRVEEQRAGHLFAVERHRDGPAHLDAAEVRIEGWKRQKVNDRIRALLVPVAQIGLCRADV